MFKTIFACIGFYFTVLIVLGVLGIGHFHTYYGREPLSCTPQVQPTDVKSSPPRLHDV